MSTEEDFTFETTSIEVTHQTTGSSMTSSSSRGTGYYIQCAVLIVTVVGAAANGMVLYAMVASKQHKKHVLIFSQNALDLANCLFLAVGISLQFGDVHLSGSGGYWLCLTLMSDAGSYAAMFGSLINLAAISIERYLKIVHNAWAKQKLRDWMIYSTAAFSWIAGIVIAAALMISTAAVVNGVCYAGYFFLSPTARKVYWIWDFMSFYVTVLLIFIFCYGRIVMVIRRQARVMAAHGGQGLNTAQDLQLNKIQASVIKTMILVCGLFAITRGSTISITVCTPR